MQENERKAFLKVKLRNLKRKFARMKEHADLTEEVIKLKAEINMIEDELK